MRKHRDALSHATGKRIKSNKYLKVERTIASPDMAKEYDMRKDGWRRKEAGKK